MIFKGMHVITCLMQISLKTLFWYWQGINIVDKINPPARASQQGFDVLLFSHSPNRLWFFPSFRICCPCERIILLLPLQWRITWQPTPHPGNPPTSPSSSTSASTYTSPSHQAEADPYSDHSSPLHLPPAVFTKQCCTEVGCAVQPPHVPSFPFSRIHPIYLIRFIQTVLVSVYV